MSTIYFNFYDIVCHSCEAEVGNIDTGVTNPWRWEWLVKEVKGTFLHETIRKLKKADVAYCLSCQQELKYRSRGFVALSTHMKSKKHISGLQQRAENPNCTR